MFYTVRNLRRLVRWIRVDRLAQDKPLSSLQLTCKLRHSTHALWKDFKRNDILSEFASRLNYRDIKIALSSLHYRI